MTVRGKSHPAEYPSMLEYLEIVKRLFNQGFDGVFYDKRFRMMRADNPMIPWSCYVAELLVRKAGNESFNSLNTTKSPNLLLWYITMTRKCAIILIAVNAHEVVVNFYTFAV